MEGLSDLIVETEKKIQKPRLCCQQPLTVMTVTSTNLKVISINAMIKENYQDKPSLMICDNDNMTQNSKIHSYLIKNDGYHLRTTVLDLWL